MLNRRAFIISASAAVSMSGRADAAEDAVSIPFQLRQLRPPRIVINASIAGKGPYGFVLDTGGITSVIQSEFARTMKFRYAGASRLGMAGTTGLFDGVIVNELVLGDALRIPHMSFASTSLINFGKDLVGSFGVEFMTQQPGLIDFDAGVWKMFKTQLPLLEGYDSQSGAISNASHAPAAYIFATVMLNDVPVRLALDTGFPGTIMLTPEALRRTGLNHAPILTPLPEGKKYLPAVRATKASLNGIDLGQPVVFKRNLSGDPYPDGIMGIKLIQMFNFAVDAKAGTLWLKRNNLPMPPETAYPAP